MDDNKGTPEVSVDGLQKSLDELLQVTDATDLSKAYGGVSVEYSGRVDESGKGGGGQAGAGDVGGLDDMMIAKMSEAGVPAGLISEFSAFMSAKQEEEEEEEEDEEESEKSESRADDDLEKSSMDLYREEQDLADAIDVSPFLEALTARTADQLDNIRKSHHVFQTSQNEVNRHMAAAMNQVGQLVKSQATVIRELGRRLNIVEATPAPQKGATTLRGAESLTKAMPGEAGEQQLKKSEILSTLSYMNLEKGIKQVNGRPTFELACMYDGGAPIDQNTVDAVRAFLRSHPHEATTARNYS